MLKNIAVILTNRCNLKCSHCLRGYPEERDDFLIGLFQKFLLDAMPFGASYIAITGGEPFIHPELDEIIKIIAITLLMASCYKWTGVITMLGCYRKTQFIDKHFILSLDGTSAEIHD